MNDPTFFLDPDSRFPELDDPTFWAQMASQVDTIALLYPDAPARPPSYPSNPLRSYPSPRPAHQQLRAPDTAIIPYRPPDYHEPQTLPHNLVRERSSPKKEGSGSALWILVISCCVVLFLIVQFATHSASTGTTVASTHIAPEVPVRINQLDRQQYSSDNEYNTWAYSACSSAAMTEVINAYTSGHTYRITDILQKEIALGEITPDLGMLHQETSIARTVAPFGFQAANVGAKPSLDDVLAVANGGRPVIVGFRDARDFPTGHILLVRGGNANQVYMTDSSKLNLHTLTRQQFLYYWDGFAVVVEPA